MPATLKETDTALRQAKVLGAARWCFLNFGFVKTSLEDIARRAGLSRTLLYRLYRDKEAIYQAVFADWLISRQPAARQAAEGSGSPRERLVKVCQLLALEPWSEMIGTPMGSDFLEVCERIDPENRTLHRNVMLECVAAILGDTSSAEVFLLALDGLFADGPRPQVLAERTHLLVDRFTSPSSLQDVCA